MAHYNHKKIEAKWQKEWAKNKYKAWHATDTGKLPKYYILDMFPYPSGDGLHVGHVEGYTATDIYSRFFRMRGYNVLHPMGWDAFGLPAENYAIKTKTHPKVVVKKNVARFKEQLASLGFSYDWQREVNTTDPEYFKWTQWIFLQLFKKGLAYEAEIPVNWCISCKTVLANEEVIDGACERCHSGVERKNLKQWVLKITAYADRLLDDLDDLDWPDKVKEMQRNWIGRSEGAEIDFSIKDTPNSIKVFTTRPDTLFGATYMVLAPEHSLVQTLKSQIKNFKDVNAYQKASINKSERERQQGEKEKTGIELKGITAINPATKKEIPVFIADYVLTGYGTGAIMAVPAHDERDFEFAKKFGLPIIPVISKDLENNSTGPELPYISNGILINSGKFNGIKSEDAKRAITEFVGGKLSVKYKLRDWIFSRQRYWGEPIPVIKCEKCGTVAVPEKNLPVELPNVKRYEPTGNAESPLAAIKSWVIVRCPQCKGEARRETNTMPQWAGSCWYYLRYIDTKNKKIFADSKKEKYWMPVDMYLGGVEHAVLHLLYARFWHKVLFDIGSVSTKEPFKKLVNQGLILGPDGQKMSKSRGNVVNPDDMVGKFGADSLRLYEMFMGPLEDAKPWDPQGIVGMRRFLDRVFLLGRRFADENSRRGRAAAGYKSDLAAVGLRNFQTQGVGKNTEQLLHRTIKKVTDDITGFHFNTAISQLMILSNEFEKTGVNKDQFFSFLKLLAPFAPHIAEELSCSLGNKKSIHLEKWPTFDSSLLEDNTFELIVQINGKVRDKFEVPINTTQKDAEILTLAREKVKNALGGQKPRNVIFVPRRLINLVL